MFGREIYPRTVEWLVDDPATQQVAAPSEGEGDDLKITYQKIEGWSFTLMAPGDVEFEKIHNTLNAKILQAIEHSGIDLTENDGRASFNAKHLSDDIKINEALEMKRDAELQYLLAIIKGWSLPDAFSTDELDAQLKEDPNWVPFLTNQIKEYLSDAANFIKPASKS